MRSLRFATHLRMFVSFSLAFVLTILPLTPFVALFYPLWLPLVLLCWAIALPEHVRLAWVWVLGLLVDVLQGNYLGEHSLVLCVLAYLAARFHLQVRMFPLIQQMLFVLVLLAVYQGLLLWMQISTGRAMNSYWAGLSLVISVLLWPLLRSLLVDGLQRG